MYKTKWLRLLAALLSLSLIAAACGGDDDEPEAGGDDTEEPADDGGEEEPADDGGGDGYEVDTSACPDDTVEEPIEGTIKIGTTMALSGGPAATAFAPVKPGLENYIAYANENELLPGYTIEVVVEDDQYNASLTTPAVEGLLDEEQVHLFSAIIGTPNNLAVRDLLNEECYPQLFTSSGAPTFGDAENYPWTMIGLAPYNTETLVYLEDLKAALPDGGTIAVHAVASEFGDYYVDTVEANAEDAGFEVSNVQRIEATDSNPPVSQLTEIAADKPDAIIAAPLGAQCPAFLNELANQKAANPGWEPRLYITSTCASPLLLTIAGPAADGLITISAAIDVADPKNAEVPEVKEYKDYMVSKGFPADGDFATAAAGWSGGEATVAVLKAALDSGELTRASIINAARSLSYHPSLFREGVTLTTDGEDDGFPLESFQVLQFNADSKTYTELGELVTSFEGTTEVE